MLATALAWCVLDEDMSKGGLLKVVDTDLGCALVDLLTVLAGADATNQWSSMSRLSSAAPSASESFA